jgi:predicted lipoprotein with Yx(FWY)xxD motif
MPVNPLLTRLAGPTIFAVLALAGCGGGGSSSSTAASRPASTTASTAAVAVSSRSVPKLGAVLVNSQGRTLYIFVPDKHAKVTCVGACAQLWPPAKLSGTQTATASGQVRASLLGSDSDPEGGRVITYAGWPLYTYISDTAPGQVTGQDVETNGGLWYVISPAGKVITAAR